MNEIFQYGNTRITFWMKDNSMMINATEMSKAFGESKRPKYWLLTQQAKEFIIAFSDARNLTSDELVKVTKGGNRAQGTWMHKNIALEFARWLSPAFSIWCNDKVEELLNKNHVSLSLEEVKFLNESQKRIIKLESQIDIDKPKIEFANAILEKGDCIPVSVLAAILTDNKCSIGRNKLYEFFREFGFVYKRPGRNYNLPTRKFIKEKIFTTRYPLKVENEDKKITLSPVTYLTPQGVQFFLKNIDLIRSFLKSNKINAK